ncbi:MAG: SDR family NAD(P)-dependent oxidoreductase, partial [Deltaproteobacteria bacterium]|nr:SDR family NAD(P)-dependent oxidoreductase [Deltaproteobacteria bacterium]
LRAEIWNEILTAEGLDPKTKPSKVRSIGELSFSLAQAKTGSAPAPAVQAAPTAAQAAATQVQEESLPPCVLNRAVVAPLEDSDFRPFTCRRVLHITGHKKTDDDVARMLEGHGIGVDSMDAEEAAGDGKSMSRLLARCDTVIYTAHGGLRSARSKAGRQAGALRREVLKLFGAFRALKRHLVEAPRRILVPISMDGCFGVDGRSENLLGSFPAGFVLSFQRELTRSAFQLIDAGETGWADTLARHLDVVSNRLMIGWREDRRVTIDQVEMEKGKRGAPPLGKDDLLLVTGGARGIVFECVRALTGTSGCRVILTGRTPEAQGRPDWLHASPEDVDDVLRAMVVDIARSGGMNIGDARREGRRMRSQWEIQRNIESLTALGVDAMYERCDVSSVDGLRKLVKKLKKRGDVVSSVVHGAGVQRAALLEDLTDEMLLATIDTKMVPVLVLAEALDWSELKTFISFGSVTGAFGNEGQTDYGLANFMLTAAGRALASRHPSVQVQTIEWTAWQGTGMVSDREVENFKLMGLTILDTESGVELFLDAVMNPDPPVQAAVYNPGAAFAMPASAMPSPRKTLLEDGTLTARFSPEHDTFLNQHLLNGQPVVPGTFVIELFAEASSASHPVSLEDVNFRRPMWIRRENHGVEVVMEDGSLRALPEQRPDVPPRALSNLQYASARMADPTPLIDLVEMATEGELSQLDAIAGNGAARAFYDMLDENFSDSLATGPIFRGLRATRTSDDRCVGLVELTPEAREHFNGESTFLFNPVASDMAVQVASSWAMEKLNVMAIPAEVERVELRRPLTGTEAVVCCRLVSMDEDRTIVDLTIHDRDGTPCYAMRNLTLRSIARVTR